MRFTNEGKSLNPEIKQRIEQLDDLRSEVYSGDGLNFWGFDDPQKIDGYLDYVREHANRVEECRDFLNKEGNSRCHKRLSSVC